MDLTEKEFLSLIDQHKGILHKVSKMYMDTPEDREDLCQEIILQLWRSYARFDGLSLFSTWMYRVALNTAITFLRKEKNRPDRMPMPPMPEIKMDYNESPTEQKLAIFYEATRLLKPIEKALIFYFMEGLSHKEIATHLGISEINARVMLNRTKEKLQQIIKKKGYEF